MKQLFLCCAMLAATTQTFATVRNVSNAASAPVNTPYTYDNLQDAIDAAADNDTLYVHGTNTNYGNVTIDNKTITIIGAGFGNNLQKSGVKTEIGTINFTNYTGVKNVSLIGLHMNEPRSGTDVNNIVNTLLIERCGFLFRDPASISNNFLRCNILMLKGSVITHPSNYYTDNFRPAVSTIALFSNNVFQGNISGSNITAAEFRNNIFKVNNAGIGVISNFNGTASFINNIFNQHYQVAASTANNGFGYNGFHTNTVGASLSNGNTNSNNLFNINPSLSFVNNANTGYVNIADFSTQVNYRLATGSPCIGSGVAGTDMGIYGGTEPIPAAQHINGVPAMPRITEITQHNSVVAPGGNLTIELKAVNQN